MDVFGFQDVHQVGLGHLADHLVRPTRWGDSDAQMALMYLRQLRLSRAGSTARAGQSR